MRFLGSNLIKGDRQAIHVPRAAVERAVLDAIGLALELRPDGTVMAYSEEARLGTLASAPLLELVKRVVAEVQVDDGDQPDPLAGILRSLDEAVQLVEER